MTDLEIVTRCAHQMGVPLMGSDVDLYDPLRDDAQAMALVKRFELNIGPIHDGWQVSDYDGSNETENKDLNRAICECVAKMEIK